MVQSRKCFEPAPVSHEEVENYLRSILKKAQNDVSFRAFAFQRVGTNSVGLDYSAFWNQQVSIAHLSHTVSILQVESADF